MAHRLAPGAEVELDEIWLRTAKDIHTFLGKSP